MALQIDTDNTKLHINNVFVIPEIKKNLLFISQLSSDYPYTAEFDSHGFTIKDLGTKAVIASGNRKKGLYALKPKEETTMFSIRFRLTSDDVWH